MFKSTISKLTVAILLAAVAFTACNKEPQNVGVESVKVSERTLLLYEGESELLKAVVTPSNATNTNVTWASDNTAVVTIDEEGLVIAQKEGQAVITVTTQDGGQTAQCEVTVRRGIVLVKGVDITPSSLQILKGETAVLTAVVTPEDASNRSVVWEANPAGIVSVTQSGVVTALAIGQANITVTTLDGNFSASCPVTVDAAEYIISFNTNGGSAIDPVVVPKGQTLTKPADPTKGGGLDGGLYEGDVDPDEGTIVFDGWYSDAALTQPYDFSTIPSSDFTLYAKWDASSAKTPIDLSGYTPTDETKKDDAMWVAFDYVNSLELDAKTAFTYVVAESNTAEVGAVLMNPNVQITVIGKGEPRVLSHNMSAAMFRVAFGDLILSRNIVVSGNYFTQNAIILENDDNTLPAGDPRRNMGGTVTLLAGSKITECTATSRAAAVYNNRGQSTFYLDGGEISNNTTEVPNGSAYGGAICANWGNMYIKSGKLVDNTTKTANKDVTIGGGGAFPMYNRGGDIFKKTGGIVSGNKAEYTGEASDELGQQLILGNHGRRNERGIYKVDAALGENDNVSVADRNTNPLWIAVHKVE